MEVLHHTVGHPVRYLGNVSRESLLNLVDSFLEKHNGQNVNISDDLRTLSEIINALCHLAYKDVHQFKSMPIAWSFVDFSKAEPVWLSPVVRVADEDSFMHRVRTSLLNLRELSERNSYDFERFISDFNAGLLG